MEAKREWVDNAFWHDLSKKDAIEAILRITDENGRVITQQLSVKKYGPNKKINPDFKEIVDQLGRAKITQNTKDRIERKQQEKKLKEEQEKSEQQRKDLEKLFELKLKVLEIDAVKNSKNRALKSKIRRAKTDIEMQMYAMLLMMEENGIEFKTKGDE